jgi:hypothetical protein
MANYCFVAPILPGGVEKMEAWIKNGILNNPDHDRVMSEAGISREQVWIQKTPMGDFAVVSMETDDPQQSMTFLSQSKEPWAVQYRDFLVNAHGFDLSQPLQMNVQMLNYDVKNKTAA